MNILKTNQNLFVVLFFLIYSCTPTAPAPPITKPVLQISNVDSLFNTSAVFGGYISDTGYSSIIDAGFLLLTDSTISLANVTQSNSTQFSVGAVRGGGGFRAKLTGLIPNKTYYVYAYATNSAGKSYSTDKNLNNINIKIKTGLSIGDSYGGGTVAYIFKPSDSGYKVNELHGLISSTSDQVLSSQGLPFSLLTTNLPSGATETAIGYGLTNTNIFINQLGNSTLTAVGLARAYIGGGFNDWFLPSKDELNMLYLNRSIIGGFSNSYWSSSEHLPSTTGGKAANVWSQNFNTGSQQSYLKISNQGVRAIRYF